MYNVNIDDIKFNDALSHILKHMVLDRIGFNPQEWHLLTVLWYIRGQVNCQDLSMYATI